MEVGVLLAKSDDEPDHSPSSVTHWVVSVGNEKMDLSENYLGRLIDGTSDSDNNSVAGSETVATKKTNPKKRKGGGHHGRNKRTVGKHQRSSSSVLASNSNHTRSVTRSKGVESELFKGIESIPVIKKPAPGPSRAVDKNCTKVKMLTGTLYLYKNPRRAEFVAAK